MCGLVGMAGAIETKHRRVLRDMLDVCQVRGRHSTGVVNVNRAKNYGYIKNVGPPAYLFDRRSYDEIIETGTHAAFIGHCRHKTAGDLSVQSAHPFDFEEQGIIGVHNGTLRNFHRLDTHDHKKVDSEILYGHLALNGPEETFNKIEGAWACVWWDQNTKRLNFIRNAQRPLWFCWSDDFKLLFWASEPWMFGAVERHIDLWDGPKKDGVGKYISLPVNFLWSFEINPTASVHKKEHFIKFCPAKEIKPKPVTLGNRPNPSWDVGWKNKKPKGTTRTWNKDERRWEEKKETKGGEVANPFQIVDNTGVPPHLLPKPDTLALIQGGKTTTGSSTSKSTTSSKSGSASRKQETATTSSSGNTLSLLPPSSTGSPPKNKEDCSEPRSNKQTNSSGSHLSPVNNRPPHATVRDLAGMLFITDGKSGKEWSEEEFEDNTHATCSFCKEPVGSLEEVEEFFGEKCFICKSCVKVPTNIVINKTSRLK